jgi:hypothetical protein
MIAEDLLKKFHLNAEHDTLVVVGSCNGMEFKACRNYKLFRVVLFVCLT